MAWINELCLFGHLSNIGCVPHVGSQASNENSMICKIFFHIMECFIKIILGQTRIVNCIDLKCNPYLAIIFDFVLTSLYKILGLFNGWFVITIWNEKDENDFTIKSYLWKNKMIYCDWYLENKENLLDLLGGNGHSSTKKDPSWLWSIRSSTRS